MDIKDRLQEDLGNTLRMAKDYERASAKRPHGGLVKKGNVLRCKGRGYPQLEPHLPSGSSLRAGQQEKSA